MNDTSGDQVGQPRHKLGNSSQHGEKYVHMEAIGTSVTLFLTFFLIARHDNVRISSRPQHN